MRSSLRLHVILFTAARVVINTLFRMVYPFLPEIGRGLGVEFSRLTQALTWRGLSGVAGPFLATFADSRGRKAGMIFGLFLFVMGASVIAIWPTFWGFVAMLILTMFGKLAFDPAVQAYLSDRIAYERRGFVLALTELGWSGGFLVGVPLMGFLIARRGWLAPFPLLALLGLIAALLLFWIVPGDTPTREARPRLAANFAAIMVSVPALAALSMNFLLSFANEIINVVFGVWLEASFGLQVAALGAASAVIGLSELSGEGIVSLVVDRLGKKRAVTIGLICNCLASIALPFLGSTLPGALAGLFLFYLSFEFTFVSGIPLLTEILPNARATLIASNFTATSLGRAAAALVAPSLYTLGFGGSAYAAAFINLLGLVALRWVVVEGER